MNWTLINTSHFKEQYKTLPKSIQSLTKWVFEILEEWPYEESLRLHKLRRPLARYHAISVNEDYRIILRILDDKKEIILHDIGTHEIYNSFL
jgi:mRNA-degrading endonuclease YafQ of YafQ-DinJ toxin-antitoxin module